jgi:riboflavin synthase
MFTGLIETLGRVNSIKKTSESAILTIEAPEIASLIKVGDSISTNGVCLTVTSIMGNQYTTDVMPITFASTNLNLLNIGSKVNLERAMTLKDRLDGHLVTGHVDAIGRISNVQKHGNATLYTIMITEDLIARMIEKGSIAVDGISLTIQKLNHDSVVVSIIPHTSKMTTLSSLKMGDVVNVESDVIGKYVERLLGKTSQTSSVDMDFLSRTGFL